MALRLVLSPAIMILAASLPLTAAPVATSSAAPLAVDEAQWMKSPRDMVLADGRPPAPEPHWEIPPEKPYPFAKGEIAQIRGVNVIAIDGEPMPGWARASGKTMLPGSPVERALREQGVKLFLIEVYLTADANAPRGEGEIILDTAPEVAFGNFRKKMDELLAAVPDARVLIRCWMTNVGGDFVKNHPDALLAGANGATDWGTPYRTESHTSRPNMLAEWRRYCGEHLYRFVHRVGASPYAGRVGGFYIAAMNTGEWWYYKGKGDPGWDFSPSRKAAFEAYVKAKYGSDRKAIAKAWQVPDTGDLWAIPSLADRKKRPLLPNSPSNDYLQLLNLPVTGAAATFARIIKVATGGRSLVGLTVAAGGIVHPVNGTVFFNHILDNPDVDFFGGPSGYADRGPGSSPEHRILHTTLAGHGKLWFNEGDLRTPLAFDTRSGALGEPPADTVAMRHVLRREWARGVVFNYPSYLMDFQWDWFYEPSFLHEMGRLLRAEAFVRKQGWTRSSEVAFVTDMDSQLYGNYFANPTREMLAKVFDRLPFPWDYMELRDLLGNPGRASRYKMIVFLNTCALGDEEREGIERLKRDGRTLVWMHDPGVVDLSQRGRKPEALLSSLTGMTMETGKARGAITLFPANPEAGGAPGASFLKEKTLNWREEAEPRLTRLSREVSLSDTSDGQPIGNRPSPYYCHDENAVPLAHDENGRAWIAMRRFEKWTSVYTAFCRMEPGFLRELARQAGCHLWSEDEGIFLIADRYIAVHGTRAQGERPITLRFPEKSDLFDLMTGKSVAEGVTEWKLPLHFGETRIFYRGDRQEAARAWAEVTREGRPAPPSSAKVPERRFLADCPQPLGKGGLLPLQGQRGFAPATFLVAGPFAGDADTLALLDRTLPATFAKKAPIWRPWGEPTGAFSRASESYLHLLTPRATVDLRKAPLLEWQGLQAPASWVSSFRMGMAPGQAYAVAFTLAAGEGADAEARAEIETRLLLSVNGEARCWVDGREIEATREGQLFVADIPLNRKPKSVVFRIIGDDESGWSVKVASAAPVQLTDDRARPIAPGVSSVGPLYPLAPGSVQTWLPEPSMEPSDPPEPLKPLEGAE